MTERSDNVYVVQERQVYSRPVDATAAAQRRGSASARGAPSGELLHAKPGIPNNSAARPTSARGAPSPRAYAQSPYLPTRPKASPRGSYTDRSSRCDQFDPYKY